MTIIPHNFRNLTIDSTLAELPCSSTSVMVDTPGSSVFQILDGDLSLPGVMVFSASKLVGMISREVFYESTGRRFGTEIYFNRPIGMMLEERGYPPVILSSYSKISLAVGEVLKRERPLVYEPVVIQLPGNTFGLVSALTLFIAQNQILLNVHNQRVYTTVNGLDLTDEEAAQRLTSFFNLPPIKNKEVLTTPTTIYCDRCGGKVIYTIADVVRAHPMLNRGMEIKDGMGSRIYILYVRHQCGDAIIEIPTTHDVNFQFRSMRASRLVDSYV